jgi:hypothetical protein
MTKLFAAGILGVSLLGATAAHAASLSNKSYTTAHKAALAGAAYKLDKAAGYGAFGAGDLKIEKLVRTTKTGKVYQVNSKAKDESGRSIRSVNVTIKKDGPGSYRAYLPNRHVYTPPSVGVRR